MSPPTSGCGTAKKNPTIQSMSYSGSLERLNHTELYQACSQAGFKVHPRATREELIAYLTGEQEPPPLDEATHPIDSWRHGIIGFLANYWAQLQPQLKCPAKMLRHPTEPDPRPCFRCLDTQVLACVVQQPPQNINHIQKHRPSRGEED